MIDINKLLSIPDFTIWPNSLLIILVTILLIYNLNNKYNIVNNIVTCRIIFRDNFELYDILLIYYNIKKIFFIL